MDGGPDSGSAVFALLVPLFRFDALGMTNPEILDSFFEFANEEWAECVQDMGLRLRVTEDIPGVRSVSATGEVIRNEERGSVYILMRGQVEPVHRQGEGGR